MSSFEDLIVYKKAFELSMQIFDATKQFPAEEKYSLTDQIRRSSRAVCANLAEGYRKRQYIAHFIAKISDADMENSETKVWLDFSYTCKYLTEERYNFLKEKNSEVGRLLGDIIKYPDKYGVKPKLEKS